jgi:hypothetical protein
MRDWQHFEARGDDLLGLFGGSDYIERWHRDANCDIEQ